MADSVTQDALAGAHELRKLLVALRAAFAGNANTHADVRAVLCVNDHGTGGSDRGPMPGLHPVHGHALPHRIDLEDGVGARDVLPQRILQGMSGWRERLRRTGVVVAGGPPPMNYENGQPVFYPGSTWPRPWGWFNEDDPELEKFVVWQVGTNEGWARYLELAERAMVAVGSQRQSLAEPFRSIVGRLMELVEARPIGCVWLLLCYQLVWTNRTDQTLRAPRRMWHKGVRLDWTDRQAQAAQMADGFPSFINEPSMAAAFADAARWRHFMSVLNANLFDVSERVLATLAENTLTGTEAQPPVAVESASKTPKTRRGLLSLAATTSKDLQVIADVKSGVSYRKAGERNGVSKSTVARIAKAHGLTGHVPDALQPSGALPENLSVRRTSKKRGAK